jgi:hypothetical protein
MQLFHQIFLMQLLLRKDHKVEGDEFKPVCVYMYIYAYKLIHMCTHSYIYQYSYEHIKIHIYIFMLIDMYFNAYLFTHILISEHIYE